MKIHAPTPIINLNAEVAGLKPTVKEYCVTYYAGEVRPADGLFPKYDHYQSSVNYAYTHSVFFPQFLGNHASLLAEIVTWRKDFGRKISTTQISKH